MCEYCRQYECPPACPNYDGYSSSLGTCFGGCELCGSGIYDDVGHYTFKGKHLCEECVEDLVSPELLDFLGCTTIKEFFDMLW